MSKFKKCTNGHFYEGDYCPYCPTQYYSPDDVKSYVGAGNLKQRALEQTIIPTCPHCRQPLRKGIPHLDRGISVSSMYNYSDHIVPWNYKWDGKCENCGHDFNLTWRINMGSTGPDHCIRETKIKAGASGFLHHITCNFGDFRSTVLSGVEIETRCGYERERFFLSANELKYLIDVLQDSPLLKQFDYYEEDDGSRY